MLLIPINTYLQVNWISSTTTSLFFNVVFVLFLLSVFSLLLRRLSPRWALNQGELLVIYIMLSLSAAIAGRDVMQRLLPNLTHPFWFATPENDWEDLFFRNIPNWLVVRDKRIVEALYEQSRTIYDIQQIKAWLVPIFWWSGFMVALVLVMICINLILRERWTQNEKLAFPIIQLPLEMTEVSGGNFFKNKFMWIGFGIAAVIELSAGLNRLIPTIPSLQIYTGLGKYFTEKPWNAIGRTPLCLYPLIVGMAFLIPLDLSFSCWVFYIFTKAELVFSSMAGLNRIPQFPFLDQQRFGAWLALSFVALWFSRKHLLQLGKQIFWGRQDITSDKDKPLSYRMTFLLLIGSLAFLFLFVGRMGMSVWVAAIFFGLYFAIATALTRVRAELGPPAHPVTALNFNIEEMMVNITGTRALGTRNLTALAFLFWFNQIYRSHPMPHQLEGFKLAERTGIKQKKMLLAMIVATIFGTLIAFWILLELSYRDRIWGMWAARTAYNSLERRLVYPSSTNYSNLTAVGIGIFFTFLLMLLRMKFIWWPLHPAGYALTHQWTMGYFWFSILVSWLIKWILLKYGGIRAHRKAIPLFLGLILGDIVLACFWSIVGSILGMRIEVLIL